MLHDEEMLLVRGGLEEEVAAQQRRCDLRHTLAPNRVAPLMVLELQPACADTCTRWLMPLWRPKGRQGSGSDSPW